ncbi:unnamed protein product [Effrenium voratum]|nr:unnamed protein product [Effrenium voratum]
MTARPAKEAGVELLVLDDGWFGHRDDDTTSLGDWVVDKRKLPRGLEGLAKDLNSMGLKLGLWVEPEMVNQDSELYKQHPEWVLHHPARLRSEGRHAARDWAATLAVEGRSRPGARAAPGDGLLFARSARVAQLLAIGLAFLVFLLWQCLTQLLFTHSDVT